MRRLPRSVVLGLAVVALVVIPFALFGDRLEDWAHAMLLDGRPTGPLPAVVCVLLLAGDVVLPVPSSLVSAAAGVWWGPWIGAAVSTLGMTLGSWLGYTLGRRADALQRWVGPAEVERLSRLFGRHGEWIVVILRPVPVLAEASAIFAGFARMDARRYYALSVAANACVSLFYAGAGALLDRAAPGTGMLLLLAVLVVVAVAWGALRRRSPAG